MSVSTILNSDLGSVRASIVRGVQWWIGQLQGLVPRRPHVRMPGPVVLFEDGALHVLRKDGREGRIPGEGARVALAVPRELAFIRTLQLPRMSAADLRHLIAMEAERLSPLPIADSVVGFEVQGAAAGGEKAPVDIAVLPIAAAESALAAAGQAGLTVASFGLANGRDRSPQFDFAFALRERGLLPAGRSPAAIWWCLVAFAFALNLAVLVIRDQQSVKRLENVAEQQAPAVTAARSMQSRAGDFDRTARDLQSQRRCHNVFSTLAIVSQDLPASAWVQRFTYGPRTARLVGYRSKDVDVAAALRKDPRIAAVRSNSAQLVADTPAGQPFDITIVLGRGK